MRNEEYAIGSSAASELYLPDAGDTIDVMNNRKNLHGRAENEAKRARLRQVDEHVTILMELGHTPDEPSKSVVVTSECNVSTNSRLGGPFEHDQPWLTADFCRMKLGFHATRPR